MVKQLPDFVPEMQTESGNPLLDNPDVAVHIDNIARGGERLVGKVSNDINEISIRRAMQIGWMMCCQHHGLPTPDMEDPATAMGYGNV